MSVWQVELSCTLEFSPISIHSLSPRSTAPNHTLADSCSRTLPITVAVSAIQQLPSAGRRRPLPRRLSLRPYSPVPLVAHPRPPPHLTPQAPARPRSPQQ